MCRCRTTLRCVVYLYAIFLVLYKCVHPKGNKKRTLNAKAIANDGTKEKRLNISLANTSVRGGGGPVWLTAKTIFCASADKTISKNEKNIYERVRVCLQYLYILSPTEHSTSTTNGLNRIRIIFDENIINTDGLKC